MARQSLWRCAMCVCAVLTLACSAKESDDSKEGGEGDGSGAGASANAGSAGTQADNPAGTDGAAGTDTSSAGTGTDGSSGTAGGTSGDSAQAGTAGGAVNEPPPEVIEMLDPDTDWTALSLIFPRMYSAHDGVHTFQVPARVDGVTVELSGWEAIPASAVSFEADPSSMEGGVLITVLEAVEEITIAASSEGLGGTAPLYVTAATPEEWELGEARYHNGIEYEMPMVTLIDLFDPNYVPPETPTDLACNNCHTTGAKYLEIQHTPSQAAYISDADLQTIFTQGMKPEGISYSVLPEPLQYLYAEFHTWQANDDEVKGLIVYLRSLTPEAQGEIQIPDTVILPEGVMP